MVMFSRIKLVIPDKPWALIFDLSLFFGTTLIELAVCLFANQRFKTHTSSQINVSILDHVYSAYSDVTITLVTALTISIRLSLLG